MFLDFIWTLRGIKTIALIGESGTGKSFRAKLVAQKYGIDLIIDDGLLIRDNRILAGH
jgi:adenylate kinase family enzyme